MFDRLAAAAGFRGAIGRRLHRQQDQLTGARTVEHKTGVGSSVGGVPSRYGCMLFSDRNGDRDAIGPAGTARHSKRHPAVDSDDRPGGVSGFSVDAAADTDVQNKLREAEARFRGAFDSAAIGMALVAPDGHWREVNPALCDLVGYSEHELLGGTFQAITPPADLDADLEFVRQMLTAEIETYQMDKRYFHKLGH